MNKKTKSIIAYSVFAVLYIALFVFVIFSTSGKEPAVHQPAKSEEQKQSEKNDWVIRETKKCEDAGLKAERVYNGWNYDTTKINCVPKKEG